MRPIEIWGFGWRIIEERRLPRQLKTLSSSILFALTITLAVGLVVWWSYFQFTDSRRMELASQLLAEEKIDEAALALGADNAADLGELARRRQVMFMSEGIVFGLLPVLGAVLFYAAMLRETRMRRNQDRFLTGATHELKTPLATIRLGLESLQDGRLQPGKQEQYLHNMIVEVDRLEKGLTNLLTAAVLRATNRSLRLEPADLSDDVREVVDAVQERSAAAGITVRASELQSAEVERDREAMRLILHNLLDNGMKYSSRGDFVEVTLQRNGNEALLSVSDSGSGMDDDEVASAFAPFYRGSNSKVGGTGLGLHLVKELVEAHGGTVKASSRSGEGSRFDVRLPIRKALP